MSISIVNHTPFIGLVQSGGSHTNFTTSISNGRGSPSPPHGGEGPPPSDKLMFQNLQFVPIEDKATRLKIKYTHAP